MRRFLTLRLIVLAVLVVQLIRVFVMHSAHVGPLEWLVGLLLLAALLGAMARAPRRAV